MFCTVRAAACIQARTNLSFSACIPPLLLRECRSNYPDSPMGDKRKWKDVMKDVEDLRESGVITKRQSDDAKRKILKAVITDVTAGFIQSTTVATAVTAVTPGVGDGKERESRTPIIPPPNSASTGQALITNYGETTLITQSGKLV